MKPLIVQQSNQIRIKKLLYQFGVATVSVRSNQFSVNMFKATHLSKLHEPIGIYILPKLFKTFFRNKILT